MNSAKELHNVAEACDNTNIKVQEDLNAQAITVAHWEQELWEKEEGLDLMIECELEALSSH
jgi:hypothetical protein